MPEPKPKPGPTCKYPWAKWLKPGSKHQLVKGKDFKSTTKTMIVYIYTRARKAGVKVQIRETAEGKLTIKSRKLAHA